MNAGAKVLLIDDEKFHADYIIGEMTALGYETEVINDLKKADAAMRASRPNLIVAHLNTKHNDVVRFVNDFKKINSNVPSIIVVEPNIPLTEKIYKAGADIVISLPFGPQVLSKSAIRLVDPLGPGKFRIHDRVDLKVQVAWCPTQSQSLKQGKTLNVSGGGFFVLETQLLPKRKEIIDFVLDFNQAGLKRLSGKAIVRWLRTAGASQELPGFGVELLVSSEEYQKNIKLMVDYANGSAPAQVDE